MTKFFDKAAVVWDKDPGRVQMAKTIADTMINELHPDGGRAALKGNFGSVEIIVLPMIKALRMRGGDSACPA